jgi:CubicO group peptidase (beta-lactamase class C family)
VKKHRFLACLLALALLPVAAIPAQALVQGSVSKESIEELTRRVMTEFDVPGMAVGIVKNGEVLHAAGYGVREIGQPGPVDTKTLFRIASASKAFTTSAVAILADRGEMNWDGPVIDYLPELRMHDPWVTANISLVDLLAHRSGLAPHAGDLLLWPVPNDFGKEDIIHALRYFPLERGFRRGYTYDNVLYIVAGEAVARVSGTSWGEFVDVNIMQALGMKRCFAGRVPKRQMRNLAAPHGDVNGELRVIERNRIPVEPTVFAAAGGVVCSLSDMLTWLQTQLGRGTSPGGQTLFSSAQSERMWSPHNWLGVSNSAREAHGTLFSAYGLGWRLRDVQGYREVSHTGSLDGWRAHALMIPGLDLGIVVLANGSSSAARSAVMYTLEYAFLPAGQRDWVEYYLEQSRPDPERLAAEEAQALEESAALPAAPLPARDLAAYAGSYRDPWFGDAVVQATPEGLTFSALRSPQLSGPLQHHSGDQFFVRWNDRSMGMDAYVRFEADPDGLIRSMSLERRLDDGQFDPDHFQYLDFERVDYGPEEEAD